MAENDSTAPELPHDLQKQLDKLIKKPAKHSKKADKSAEDLGEVATVESGAVQADTAVTPEEPEAAEPTEGVELPDAEAPNEVDEIVESTATDAAVDDIVHGESDAVLALDDAAREARQPAPKKPHWWQRKWLRWLLFLLIIGGLTVLAVFPDYRYKALNAVGVRSSVTLTVIDSVTQLPLKNVTVTLGGQKVASNAKGYVDFKHVKLGQQTLSVRHLAYTPVTENITVGWGSNPQGDLALSASGVQYIIQVEDYVSGQPVTTAEADSGQSAAVADKKGIVSLELEAGSSTSAQVTVSADGYRNATFTLSDTASGQTMQIKLVPSVRSVAVVKDNDIYNLVSMDLDGKNAKTVLAGTGLETGDIGLATDSAYKEAALVSTRDQQKDSDGNLLNALTMVNLDTGVAQTIDHAAKIELVDWIGTKLVYQESVAGANATDPQRYRLISYDYASSSRVQLAIANQFDTVVTARGLVYYSVAANNGEAAALYSIKPDGTGKQTVQNSEIWNAYVTGYNTLLLQAPDSWYSYDIGAGEVQKLASAPTDYQSRMYVANSAGQYAWVGADGDQKALYVYDSQSNKDTKLLATAGLDYPVRWLTSNLLVYRVHSGGEAADYVYDIRGGEPKKIANVADSTGFSQAN